jgi:hypothetical protein
MFAQELPIMKTAIAYRLFIFLIAVFLTAACGKEAVFVPPESKSFEQRLEGFWQLKEVKYAAELPNPQNPLQTINLEGEGEDVEGLFVLGHDPNNLDYAYEFVANLQVFDSIPPIPVPVEREGSGSWSSTSDESRIFVTEDDQTTYTFIIIENTLTRQVYQTTIEETIMGIFTIEADVELTFERLD